jgi:hypothetical protein
LQVAEQTKGNFACYQSFGHSIVEGPREGSWRWGVWLRIYISLQVVSSFISVIYTPPLVLLDSWWTPNGLQFLKCICFLDLIFDTNSMVMSVMWSN